MKKNLLSISSVLIIAGIAIFAGCKKEDTTAPVVTLKGNASATSVLNAAYSDPGATASDDEDGDITTSIVVTGTVNKDLKGSYTLTYTATDAAGNVGTATRTVKVENSAENLAGNYSTTDTNPAISGTYTITVSTSSTTNNKIILNNLGKYGTDVNATVSGTSISIASQSMTTSNICTGTPIAGTILSAGSTGTASNGTVNTGTTITMSIPYYFSWTQATCVDPAKVDYGTASLTKQ